MGGREGPMSEDALALARRRFGDELALLAVDDCEGYGSRQAVVDAATDLLVLGVDGDAVVALASAVVSPLTSAEFDELAEAASEELGMPALDRDAMLVRATQHQLRRWRAGEMST